MDSILEKEVYKLKKALAEQQQKLVFYDLAVKKTPQSVWMLDEEGKILLCSAHIDKMLSVFCGSSVRDFTGENLYALLENTTHVALSDMIKRNDDQVRAGNGSMSFEEVVPSDTELRTYLSHKKCFIHPEDGKTYLLGLSIDITERKKMEQEMLDIMKGLRLADRTKRTFIQNFRHDLKTPISNIIGAADLIMHSKGREDADFFLETIKASGLKLMSHIDQLAEVSASSKDVMPVKLQEVSVQEEVRSVTDSVEAIARAKKLSVAVHIAADVPEKIIIDPLRFHRILSNLLSNALKYTETGNVSIEVEYVDAKNSNCIEIHVVDTGIGIEEKFQQLIFSPLMRIQTELDESDGAGLGLSIVREFINDLSGQIFVSSAVGRGSRFTVLIPLPNSLD